MGTGGLNLPGVEKAMAEMEGGSAEDMKERFARIARRVCFFDLHAGLMIVGIFKRWKSTSSFSWRSYFTDQLGDVPWNDRCA